MRSEYRSVLVVISILMSAPAIADEPQESPRPRLPEYSGQLEGGAYISAQGDAGLHFSGDLKTNPMRPEGGSHYLILNPGLDFTLDANLNGGGIRKAEGDVTLGSFIQESKTEDGGYFTNGVGEVGLIARSNRSIGLTQTALRLSIPIPGQNRDTREVEWTGAAQACLKDDVARMCAKVRPIDLVIGQVYIQGKDSGSVILEHSAAVELGFKAGNVGYIGGHLGGRLINADGANGAWDYQAGLGVDNIGNTDLSLRYVYDREQSQIRTADGAESDKTYSEHMLTAVTAW